MPTATATQPLQVLAQRISQHETELAQLRKEYETRQKQLTALARRKEQLQEQLEQVEAEIANVDHASAASTPSAKPKPMSVSTPRAKPATGAHASNGASPTTDKAVSERISLPKLLINLVQRASKPVSISDLVAGVVSNKYPTKAKDLHAMVKNRVSDLVREKALKRVGDQPGVVVLGKASAQHATTKATSRPGSNSNEKVVTAKPVAASKSIGTGSEKTLSLKEAMMQVLAKTSRPLSAQELADRVVANGYETKSKDLKNVIWVAAGKLENVENVKGEGYRLKAGKTTTNKKKG